MLELDTYLAFCYSLMTSLWLSYDMHLICFNDFHKLTCIIEILDKMRNYLATWFELTYSIYEFLVTCIWLAYELATMTCRWPDLHMTWSAIWIPHNQACTWLEDDLYLTSVWLAYKWITSSIIEKPENIKLLLCKICNE